MAAGMVQYLYNSLSNQGGRAPVHSAAPRRAAEVSEMPNMMIVWLIAIVVMAVAELATMQLVAIWIAVGGVCALIADTLGCEVWVQFTVFIAVSAVLLVFTRPICRRFLSVKRVGTNADRLIGTVAVVSQDIDNLAQTGRAEISGVSWMARSAGGEKISAGEKVKIEKIEGVKLIVAPCAHEKSGEAGCEAAKADK
jgi:membrane protein implicated in regulation of membrane protease activity